MQGLAAGPERPHGCASSLGMGMPFAWGHGEAWGTGGSFAWRSGTHFPCCKQVPTRTGHMQTPGAGVKIARVQFSQAQTLRAARRLHSSCRKQPPPGLCVWGGVGGGGGHTKMRARTGEACTGGSRRSQHYSGTRFPRHDRAGLTERAPSPPPRRPPLPSPVRSPRGRARPSRPAAARGPPPSLPSSP